MHMRPTQRAFRGAAILVVLVLSATACGDSPSDEVEREAVSVEDSAEESQPRRNLTVLDVLVTDGRFTTFLDVLENRARRGLVRAILANPDFNRTLLAPTDEAFAALPSETRKQWVEDEDNVSWLATHHLVQGLWSSADLTREARSEDGLLTTLGTPAGWVLRVTADGDRISIAPCPDGRVSECGDASPDQLVWATVIETDVAASNGIIHVLDTVLVPTTEAPFG